MLTIGLDMVIIGTIIYRVELQRQLQFSSFFTVFGKNPLVIYLFSELLATTLYTLKGPGGADSLFSWIFQNSFAHLPPYWASLGFAFAFMLVCWLLGYILDKYKIYIRV
jgi:predicted acyltransferase